MYFQARRYFYRSAIAIFLVSAMAGAWAGFLQLTGNIHEVRPAALYRSAQLNGDDLTEVIKEKGIRTVLNLRGAHPGEAWYDEEIRAAAAAGVEHIDISLSATEEPSAAIRARLVEVLIRSTKPMLLHCKSGADRTGLASALYEYIVAGLPADQASEQLSFRYGHFPWLLSRSGAMDETFRHVVMYEAMLPPMMTSESNHSSAP